MSPSPQSSGPKSSRGRVAMQLVGGICRIEMPAHKEKVERE